MLHFDVTLNYVAWIQVPYGFEVLGQGLFRLILDRVKLVAVFFANFRVYLSRKLRAQRNALRFLEQALFQQVLNFQIVLHFDELEDG